MYTIQDTLTHVLGKLESGYDVFICNEIESAHDTYHFITEELSMETLDFFNANKPTKDLYPQFFNNKVFSKGTLSWWGNNDDISRDDERKERARFLRFLIDLKFKK